MRPIRQPNPELTQTKGGRESSKVQNYQEWRADLVEQYGSYCAYCDINISGSLGVDHIGPQNPKSHELDCIHVLNRSNNLNSFNNLLLACGNCNNFKSNHIVNDDKYYLPHLHNTLLAFDFEKTESIYYFTDVTMSICEVKPKSGLNQQQKDKALRTISFFRLNDSKDIQTISGSKMIDRRASQRGVAFGYATIWLLQYHKADASTRCLLLELLPTVVKPSGFFSVWWHVFTTSGTIYPELLDVLLGTNVFPGTKTEVLDREGNLRDDEVYPI